MEIWAKIPAFPDYAVSNCGRVMRLTSRTYGKAGTILKQAWSSEAKADKGYLRICVCRNGKCQTKSVHVLVAEAFIGPRPPGYVTNHKDTDRSNNADTNLEWVTQSENVKHAYAAGCRDCRGEGNGQAVLTESDVLTLRRLALGGPVRGFYAAQARLFGVSATTIRDAVKERTWTHLSQEGAHNGMD